MPPIASTNLNRNKPGFHNSQALTKETPSEEMHFLVPTFSQTSWKRMPQEHLVNQTEQQLHMFQIPAFRHCKANLQNVLCKQLEIPA